MRTALVTGATGLVGMHLIPRLQRDGWQVRALVRDPARAGLLSRADVTLATGDVLEPTSFARAARGCDVLFHAAAVITPLGGWEAFRRPNVEGTRNAITAAKSASARLVHVSSVAVYGDRDRYSADGRLTDESKAGGRIAEDSFYARSKRESEALVMDAQAQGVLWATAVRPSVLYGPFDRQFVPRLARLLRHGFAPVIAGGGNTLAIVHAANVADGLVRAASFDGANGKAYNLTNDYDVTAREFFERAAEGLDQPVRIISIPMIAARVAFAVAGIVAPLVLGNRFKSQLSSSLDFLARDNPFSSELARRELGWDPPVRPETGIAESFRWWAAHH
ncbi:MAG TPA: NAD-dependent epimerase/dehydratase family protein [Gemmatimonadaceae bacterium]|nr:NAD-dependent epimerase/dehydratase family protein [Gemmatimonadaceae bacterium]